MTSENITRVKGVPIFIQFWFQLPMKLLAEQLE
ncbi:Uncharacterised protein [Vibrio cholerae]|nr:Uncharacterised protein [Vibrio cholerae]